MGILAGIYLPDGGPVSPQDRQQILDDLPPVQSHAGPSVFLAGNASHLDPGGIVCHWDAAGDLSAAGTLYQRRGVAGLRDLIGDWSLALWDAAGGALVLAGDYAGVRPLYYGRRSDGALFWCSRLDLLVRWTGAAPLDGAYVETLLERGAVAHLTPYRGISAVPAGGAIVLQGARLRQSAFWTLPAGKFLRYRNEADYEDHFRSLFAEAVASRLDTAGPVSAELSGGLDSSSVVAMAHRLIPDRLATFSYCHQGSTDAAFIGRMEQRYGLDATHLSLDECPLLTPSLTGGAAPALWEPRFREVSRRMAATGSRVLLTGRIGDLVMGNWSDDSGQVAGHLRAGRWLRATREAFAWSHALRVPVYSILWQALRGSVAAWWHDVPPERRAHFAALSGILATRSLQCPDSLLDISYTHPYAHRPLVEFMLTIPADIVCRPGEPRRLMRRALAGIVPDFVLRRRSKAIYDGIFLRSLRPLAAELLRDLPSMHLVRRGYVDPIGLAPRLHRLMHGLECNEPQLRHLILLEFWLRRVVANRSVESQSYQGTASAVPQVLRTLGL